MSSPKILLVEDDDDLNLSLSIRLRSFGYDVVRAIDAITAITVYKREQPDLVLLDLGLPGGGGFTVLERLRRLGTRLTPVIVLTARPPAETKDKALALGATAFFQKPVDGYELLAAVQDALGGLSVGTHDSASQPTL